MIVLKALMLALPWPLRRLALRWLFGYDLHPSSRIGFAWVFPRRLSLGPGARIDHLTVCKGVDALTLGASARIGRLNWITGFPLGQDRHFTHLPDRRPELVLGAHASITNRHIIDCTERVSIGPYTTLAGFRSQILTHSIDLGEGRQSAAPIDIGTYCFIGTDATILGGARLPDHSVLGAKSLLNKAHDRSGHLYAGVPARPIKALDRGGYFSRAEGYVY